VWFAGVYSAVIDLTQDAEGVFAGECLLKYTYAPYAPGRGLHSFPFSLNLSLLCPFPLNFSLLSPPCNPN
jgi:hypothetical protein